MAISLNSIITGVDGRPPRILVFGPAGVGKTTFGADAPCPIFLPTEDGIGMIDVPRFPLATSFGEVIDALKSLAAGDHEFKTLVIDSLDWLEPLIWREVCVANNVKAIESIPYGRGFLMALDFWRDYLEGINFLRNERGMMIIETAHTEIKRFDSPDSDAYDRYVIKLHKSASALLQEHSDCIFFANYRVSVTEENTGFNQKRRRAIGSGKRSLFAQEKPGFVSKNRYNLPESIPFDGNTWGALSQYIPFLHQFAQAATASPQQETTQTQTEGA